MNKTLKGRYRPKSPDKYVGDANNIIYRSSWELRFLNYLDRNPNVLHYSSEELAIPYISPVDKRLHHYFPDFVVRVKRADGTIQTMMVEIKPYSQTIPPVLTEGKRKTKYAAEVARYAVNDAKWKAARTFCEERLWDFKIITEKELNIR